MTVILILATFLVFILIDFFLTRHKAPPVIEVEEPVRPALLSSTSVEGIMVPDQIRYHAGHTWLSEERPGVARVGADALAARVLGHIDRVIVPEAGRWVRQGQKALAFWIAGEKVELVSPVEGEVLEINTEVLKDPSLVAKDPYGRGWLVKVNVPERETVGRNLLPPSLVRNWMREDARRARAAQPLAAVMTAGAGQDTTFVHDRSWAGLTRELFLA